MEIKKHYDKLLHISITFGLMMFATTFLSIEKAVGTVFMLQVMRTLQNVTRDKAYRPWGDWLANSGGYLLYGLYWMIGR